MSLRRKRRDFELDPFTDLLFNALLGITFMFLLAFVAMNPKAKTGTIEAKAEFIITVTWPDNSPDDIDTWVESPDGEVVWFKHPDAGLMHLDRDDRGLVGDQIIVDGRVISNPLNEEVVTLRGVVPGEYTVNVQYYESGTRAPVPVEVRVVKVNPHLSVVYYGQLKLEHINSEVTAVRFTVMPDGRVTGINTLTKPLAAIRGLK